MGLCRVGESTQLASSKRVTLLRLSILATSKPSFLRRKINKDKSSMKVWCSLNCYYAGSGTKEAQTGSAGVYQTIKQSAINIYEIFRNLFSLNPAVM